MWNIKLLPWCSQIKILMSNYVSGDGEINFWTFAMIGISCTFLVFVGFSVFIMWWVSIKKTTSRQQTMFYHVWPCLTMFDHLWPRLTMFDHVWPSLTTFALQQERGNPILASEEPTTQLITVENKIKRATKHKDMYRTMLLNPSLLATSIYPKVPPNVNRSRRSLI